MAKCIYCGRNFRRYYPAESVCSKLCGSFKIEELAQMYQSLETRHSAVQRQFAEVRVELAHSRPRLPEPEAFTLDYIREIVDG